MNIILKSLLRKPAVLLIIIFLIGLVSFGFVGKAVETFLVYRETTRLEKYYRSIGYIEQSDFENELNPFQTGADLIRQSPALEFDDLRIQTAGFMRDYYNTDFHSGTMDVGKTLYSEPSFWYGEGVNNLDYWFYGKLIDLSKEYESDPKLKKIQVFTGYQLIFQVEEVLAGYPERIEESQNYVVWIPVRYTENIDEMSPFLESMEVGRNYLIRGWSHPSFNFSVVGLPISVVNQYETMNLKPLDGQDLWFIPVEDNQRIDLNQSEYKFIRQEVDRLNQNLRSILLVGTADMSAMPEMQLDAKYNYLVDGRWLNRDDDLSSKAVMVISKNLADTRGLSVGDELTITMVALKDPFVSFIRSAEDIANWRSYPSQEVTYEIVGVYSNSWMDSSQVFENFFSQSFVPLSTIPQEYAYPAYWSGLKDRNAGYSFVLKDPRNQAEFVEVYGSKLESLGFTLKFSDNEGKNYAAGVDPLRKSNLIGVVLYALALLLAIALSVFVYFRQQQRNFAILRALGVPKTGSNQQLLLPLLILGLIGSGVGAVFSWGYAHGKAGESLSQLPLPSGVLPELRLNVWIGIGLWLLILLFLLMGTQIGSKRLNSRPVLALLQDDKNKEKTKIRVVQSHQEQVSSTETELLTKVNKDSLRGSAFDNQTAAVRDFSRLNIVRSPFKNLLVILVAAALLLSLGWFRSQITASQKEITRLYESNPVQIDVVSRSEDSFNPINRNIVDRIKDTQFISEAYLSVLLRFRTEFDEKTGSFIGFPPYNILAVNNLDQGLLNRLEGYKISWAPGFSPKVFSESKVSTDDQIEGVPVIVPEEILLEQGWELGNSFTTELENIANPIEFQIVGSSIGGTSAIRTIMRDSKGSMLEFDYRHMIASMSAIEHYYPDISRYTEVILFSEPTLNSRLPELKASVKKLLEDTGNSTINVTFWDEELLAVIGPLERNFSLMERLYPLTVFLAGVLGGLLCLFLVMNQEKEMALLRMLGVEKQWVTRMQVGQILMLSVIGLIIGAIALLITRGVASLQWSLGIAALIYLMGALLGTLAGSTLVARKKPMESLQVKE